MPKSEVALAQLPRMLAQELCQNSMHSCVCIGCVAQSESVIRRAMLAFAEQAEKAVCELPSFHRNGEFNSVEMRSMAAAAIRELAEGLKP